MARPNAITPATMPSIRSVDFFLLGLMLPTASISTATFDAIQRMTGLPPWHSLQLMTSDGDLLDLIDDLEFVDAGSHYVIPPYAKTLGNTRAPATRSTAAFGE